MLSVDENVVVTTGSQDPNSIPLKQNYFANSLFMAPRTELP